MKQFTVATVNLFVSRIKRLSGNNSQHSVKYFEESQGFLENQIMRNFYCYFWR